MTPYFKAFGLLILFLVLLIFTLNHAHAADAPAKEVKMHPLYWLGAESCGRSTIWFFMDNGWVTRHDSPVDDELREFVSKIINVPHDTVTFDCPTRVST